MGGIYRFGRAVKIVPRYPSFNLGRTHQAHCFTKPGEPPNQPIDCPKPFAKPRSSWVLLKMISAELGPAYGPYGVGLTVRKDPADQQCFSFGSLGPCARMVVFWHF